MAAPVLVCGGGMSGLVAALRAAEQGAPVVLAEKSGKLGGSARLSAGFLWTFRDQEEIEARIPRGSSELQEIVVGGLDDAAAWLGDKGVRLSPKRGILDFGHGYEFDPAQGIAALEECLRGEGAEILTNTSLGDLSLASGRIAGARLRRDGGESALEAGAVVLATGGFQGNAELLRRYVADPDNLYLRANPWSTGDGFTAATEIGAAASAGLSRFYGHAMLGPPTRFSSSLFAEVTQYQGRIAVALNLAGERFADESAGTGEEYLNQRLAEQPEGRGFYLVDAEGIELDALPGLIRTDVVIERARKFGGVVLEAETLEELCRLLGEHGVPSERALRTINEYNDAVGSDRADALHPRRGGDRLALASPPFVAVGVKAAITFTHGGLAVDDTLRVLCRSASSSVLTELIVDLDDYRPVAIPGLFAAGADVGNISHDGYCGGLATATTTGLLAGREAAAFQAEASGSPA